MTLSLTPGHYQEHLHFLDYLYFVLRLLWYLLITHYSDQQLADWYCHHYYLDDVRIVITIRALEEFTW